MNDQQQFQLEDAQKKLSIFRKHLDLLARCTGESQNVDPNEVLSAVAELQSLVEWAAQQPDLGAENAVLLVKLQELHQIRENLEKTSTTSEECSYATVSSPEDITIPEKSESHSNGLEYFSDIVAENLRDNNGENFEEDNTSIDKDSLGEYSASTEDPHVANAESPQSLEDVNVDFILSDEKTDLTVSIDGTDASNKKKDTSSYEEAADGNVEVQETVAQNETELHNTLESDEISPNCTAPDISSPNCKIPDAISPNSTTPDVTSPNSMIPDVTSPNSPIPDVTSPNSTIPDVTSPNSTIPDVTSPNSTIPDVTSPNSTLPDVTSPNSMILDVTSPNSTTADVTSPNSTIPDVTSPNYTIPEITSPNLFRSEVIIIETDEDSKSAEWINDPKNSNDPLDVCMYAIRNLYESLRVKENELLKLSAMQNDQKQIEALQAVIIDFHKDITNLNTELEKSRKENSVLKEQVLELEEAENDARLEAQKLEQKLVFLQEKDSHSQAELTQLKQSLKKSTETLAEKEVLEKELRSQIKYMDTLVQKYEDQIKVMEARESASSKNEVENPQTEEEKSDMTNTEKRVICNKGTQTYPPSQTKINCTPDESKKNSLSLNGAEGVQTNEESNEIVDKNTEDCGPRITSNESAEVKEKDDFANIENNSEKELLKRLHKLIDEDVSLQQQIHYVDEINLAMWKKLQNLDNHIGECKRQNINETNPAVSETELNNAGGETSVTDVQEPSATSTNENIPNEGVSCLDQNEQYIQERLMKLEEINASFEKELKTRENLYKEKEKKYEEWLETEKLIKDDLKRLADERDWITEQITKLRTEQEARQATILQIEEEVNALKGKNQSEAAKIRAEQETAIEPMNLKVNEMLTKEKEILKMITNLKTEKNRSQGKSELERLKCNYIQLQIELSQARDEIRKIEDHFQLQIDQCTGKHLLEDNPRVSELERLRNERVRSDKIISNLETKHKNILNALEKQEQYLQNTRESFKKNLEETEEEHRSVETELKSQLQLIEEGTAIATTALMEERMKVEQELKENIEDLKAKEEIYKAKIIELESNVSNLHEELHKLATESASKNEVEQDQEDAVQKVDGKITEIPCSKTDHKILNETAPQPASLVSSDGNTVRESTPTQLNIKTENMNNCNANAIEKKVPEENVDELRAQVRELQCELEKISEKEIPPVQPVTPITAKSLKMQKVEDLDYAEVDECSLEAWRKNLQNQNRPEPKAVPPNVQAVYDDKYSTGYKDNFQNHRLPVREQVEENDYDEVLPRPTNFHVVQQVGSDTLLVGWNYVNPSVLDGFEVYLGDQVHERIYIPDRTKALISGLNLRKPIRLSICALSRYGQMSEPAVLELPALQELHTQFLVDEDEYRDIEDPMKRNSRPYSMEW